METTSSSSVKSVDEVVEEIMRIHRSLPTRPGIDEVEAAKALIINVEREDQARVEAIARQSKSPHVPEELFMILQEMQKNLVYFQSREQKREALKLLDLENAHSLFDEFIQRASKCVTKSSFKTDGIGIGFGPSTTSSTPQIFDSSLKPPPISGQDGDKLSLIKLASLIEVSAKKGTRDLNLQNKLMDQIEWLPDTVGKLSSLISLDLSENRIVALPATIGGLSSLTKLDLHANRISELPESIGDLLNLIYLDLRANQLLSLPATFGRLIRLQELDLSSNQLYSLPELIGSLVSLRKLNVETNNIEEIPHSIGRCTSLRELRADYNRLKALPEAVGKINTLEVLSVRYNNIKQLPTTMSSLSDLRELDVSFNELESVPESLCFATKLVKMNIGNNFADMTSLPRSIGNLEMLEELDISNNQIRFLPDSFRMLTRLRVLRVEENPLEVPPRQIAEKGAQAVVQYMIDLHEKREKGDVKSQSVKQKKSWTQMCFFSRSNKRKRGGANEVKA
ncbi:plant intracellular ras-group-related lrr protein 4 [Quercus suber]|uniref:Plant intracellular ras-group-related lrr protein 4 n=1 Tax=Quercus suber TaxID=58331 RepID=A0AAW0LZ84_QUESU